jgi:hypothetical protein
MDSLETLREIRATAPKSIGIYSGRGGATHLAAETGDFGGRVRRVNHLDHANQVRRT